MFYVFVLCDYHQYHGVLVRWRCSCGDTFTCNCPILVLNKVYYYYYYIVVTKNNNTIIINISLIPTTPITFSCSYSFITAPTSPTPAHCCNKKQQHNYHQHFSHTYYPHHLLMQLFLHHSSHTTNSSTLY